MASWSPTKVWRRARSFPICFWTFYGNRNIGEVLIVAGSFYLEVFGKRVSNGVYWRICRKSSTSTDWNYFTSSRLGCSQSFFQCQSMIKETRSYNQLYSPYSYFQ